MDLASVQPLFNQLREAFARVAEANAGELATCRDILQKLKAAVFAFSLDGDQTKLLLARETLEIGCLVSIMSADVAAFERYVTQLKLFYQDYAAVLPKSTRQDATQGLLLLHLLSYDRIGEFHIELEVIPSSAHGSEYVAKAIELEQHVMEGNYRKILDTSNLSVPRYYSFFMDQLTETVRLKVGSALEKSYDSLPAKAAASMLMLPPAELASFVDRENELKLEKEQQAKADAPEATELSKIVEGEAAEDLECRWSLKDNVLRFVKPTNNKATIPALELVANAIGYATDLERIV